MNHFKFAHHLHQSSSGANRYIHIRCKPLHTYFSDMHEFLLNCAYRGGTTFELPHTCCCKSCASALSLRASCVNAGAACNISRTTVRHIHGRDSTCNYCTLVGAMLPALSSQIAAGGLQIACTPVFGGSVSRPASGSSTSSCWHGATRLTSDGYSTRLTSDSSYSKSAQRFRGSRDRRTATAAFRSSGKADDAAQADGGAFRHAATGLAAAAAAAALLAGPVHAAELQQLSTAAVTQHGISMPARSVVHRQGGGSGLNSMPGAAAGPALQQCAASPLVLADLSLPRFDGLPRLDNPFQVQPRLEKPAPSSCDTCVLRHLSGFESDSNAQFLQQSGLHAVALAQRCTCFCKTVPYKNAFQLDAPKFASVAGAGLPQGV